MKSSPARVLEFLCRSIIQIGLEKPDHFPVTKHLSLLLVQQVSAMEKSRYGAIIFAVIFTAAIVLLLR